MPQRAGGLAIGALSIGALAIGALAIATPVHAQVVWVGDFETGDTSQLDGELNGTVGGADQIMIVGDPVAQGSHAARIELVNDAVWPNGLKRVELHHSPAAGRTADGEELYFAWSFLVPETLPRDPEATIGYWETDASYQQLMAFALIGSDLRFSTNHPSWRAHWTGEGVITPGVWHRLAVHVLWSRDETVGSVDVWLDGEQVVTAAHAQTLVDDNGAFTQMGLLRGAIEFTDAPVIVLDDLVEGDSLESVRPDALRPPPDAGVSEDAGTAPLDAGAASSSDASSIALDAARSTADVRPGAETLDGTCACATGARRGATRGLAASLFVTLALLARRRARSRS